MERRQKVKIAFTYIIGIAMMYILFYGIAFQGAIVGLVPSALGFDENIAIEFAMVIGSFVVLFIYWLIFRKRKFKGVFSFGKGNKDVYIGLGIAVIVDIIGLTIAGSLLEGGIKTLVPPTLSTFAISLSAGVYEETSFRAVPISIFMKNKPSTLRIYLAVVITALGFALAHAGNVTLGASVQITVLQVCSCFITGIFLAAVYLRTGSILLPMCFHFFHDIINLMLPAQSTGVMLQQTITGTDLALEIALSSVELLVGIYLLRKSKLPGIKSRWADIWNEEI